LHAERRDRVLRGKHDELAPHQTKVSSSADDYLGRSSATLRALTFVPCAFVEVAWRRICRGRIARALAGRRAARLRSERITRSFLDIADDMREVHDDAETSSVSDVAQEFDVTHDPREWFGASGRSHGFDVGSLMIDLRVREADPQVGLTDGKCRRYT
jgi:hypothetical protein